MHQEQAPSADVAVIGQAARDVVLQVEEFPPSGGSAGAVRLLEQLGGKGANQAVGLAQLGLHPALLAVVGDDDDGARLLIQARIDGIDIHHIVRRPETRTALFLDVVDRRGDRRLIEHVPEGTLLRKDDVAAASTLLTAVQTVVIQLQQPAETARAAAQVARRAHRRVVLDGVPAEAAPRDDLLRMADVLRLDGQEANLLLGRPVDSAQAALRAGRELLRCGPSLVALAAGQEANVLVWRGGEQVFPLIDAPVVDRTGAGDAYTAALTAVLTRDGSPAAAGQLASAAAASAVGRLGGRPDLRAAGLAGELHRLTSAG